MDTTLISPLKSWSPRLPPELCDLVIDFCFWMWYSRHCAAVTSAQILWRVKESPELYSTLSSCALTCRSWLHRSRINLYRWLYVGTHTSSLHLVRTLASEHFSRALIHTMCILDQRVRRPGKASMSITFLRLAPFANPNVLEVAIVGSPNVTSAIYMLNIGRDLHTTFFMSCASYKSLRSLSLVNINFPSPAYFCRLLSAFKALRSLLIVGISIPANDPSHLRLPPSMRRICLEDLHIQQMSSYKESIVHRCLFQAGLYSRIQTFRVTIPSRSDLHINNQRIETVALKQHLHHLYLYKDSSFVSVNDIGAYRR